MEKRGGLYVIDNVILGNNHVVNNAGVLNVLRNLYSGGDKISFYSDKAHASNVQLKLYPETMESVDFHSISVIDPSGVPSQKIKAWHKKLKVDKQVVLKLFKKAREEKPALIYFCTLMPVNIFRFMSVFRSNPKQRIIIGLHGEVEFLYRKKQSLKDKLNAIFYRKAFANIPDNVKFNVLSPLIRKRLVESGFLKENQIIWIEHPIQNTTRPRVSAFPEIPVFSFLGVASKRKNGGSFFDLANHFKRDTFSQKFRFELVGKIAPELRNYPLDGIHWGAEENKSIPQEKYEEHCLKATYSLCFLKGNEYIFRISGSLMDSVQYHLPVIALKHEYVNYLFEQGGDIGFVCQDLSEMENIIRRIVNKDTELVSRYAQQVENMKNLATRFYDENNVMNLQRNLEKIGWSDMIKLT